MLERHAVMDVEGHGRCGVAGPARRGKDTEGHQLPWRGAFGHLEGRTVPGLGGVWGAVGGDWRPAGGAQGSARRRTALKAVQQPRLVPGESLAPTSPRALAGIARSPGGRWAPAARKAAPPPWSRVVAAVAEEGRSGGPRCPGRRRWCHPVWNEGKCSGCLRSGTPRNTAGKENSHCPPLRLQFPGFLGPFLLLQPPKLTPLLLDVAMPVPAFPLGLHNHPCPLSSRLLCPRQQYPSPAPLSGLRDKSKM